MRWLVPTSIVTLPLVITPAHATTVTTSQFTVTWGTSDPEAITPLSWVGSSLTNSFGRGACNDGDVE